MVMTHDCDTSLVSWELSCSIGSALPISVCVLFFMTLAGALVFTTGMRHTEKEGVNFGLLGILLELSK